jgi:hypothetical protein
MERIEHLKSRLKETEEECVAVGVHIAMLQAKQTQQLKIIGELHVSIRPCTHKSRFISAA